MGYESVGAGRLLDKFLVLFATLQSESVSNSGLLIGAQLAHGTSYQMFR